MIEARIKKTHAVGKDSAAFELDVQFRASNGVTVVTGCFGVGSCDCLDCKPARRKDGGA